MLSHEENRGAAQKNGGGQNARATGGPGILPVTKRVHWSSRKNMNEPRLRGRRRDVWGCDGLS
jgi:hypothetical protein